MSESFYLILTDDGEDTVYESAKELQEDLDELANGDSTASNSLHYIRKFLTPVEYRANPTPSDWDEGTAVILKVEKVVGLRYHLETQL